MNIRERINRITIFLTDEIWRTTDDELGRLQRMWYDILKVMVLTIRRFSRDNVTSKASALTYSTIMAVVPVFAVVFAIGRGFGYNKMLEMQIRKYFGNSDSTIDILIDFVNSYLEHTRNGMFLGFGIILLLWTVLNLTNNIEHMFNNIWQVNKERSMFRTFTDYCSLLLLMPLLVIVMGGLSIFATTVMKTLPDFLLLGPVLRFTFEAMPFLLSGTIVSVLYMFMPNTKVKLRYAVIPGFLAGAGLQILQYIYIDSQIWVSSYNAIYGSFAAIPLFMLMAQFSWTICLFGAEMNYAAQNLQYYNFENETVHISRRYRDFLTLIIASLICKRFEEGGKPYSSVDLASEHKIPIRLVNEILYMLVDIGVLVENSGDEKAETPTYMPAVSVNRLSVESLFNKIDMNGSENFKIDVKNFQKYWLLVNDVRTKMLADKGGCLLKDL
ncbi:MULTISPECIES: YihY/virulence factor BrkB family protein [unclassified Bacteroides]|uniref:YihY/virulence factor BrkB family protein n=1 Tax=unclassified Bacteroides TaxID=2646097 RepID=UPI000ADB65F5|nr:MULTISPECIES: YihY/virulence factor BrkB family protein [unclassified Bacteroides]